MKGLINYIVSNIIWSDSVRKRNDEGKGEKTLANELVQSSPIQSDSCSCL